MNPLRRRMKLTSPTAQMADLSQVHGGSPWGAGTFASSDGSRQPSPLELELATIQGRTFYETVSKAIK